MLQIVHINDTETAVAAWARISTLVRDLRNQGACDLLLHAGDIRLSAPNDPVEAMNQIGFDAITLGNHDFDHGLEKLAPQLGRLHTAKVCANADGLPGVAPYRWFERQGLKVAVVGLTTEAMDLLQPERNLPGVRFRAAAAALQEAVASVRQDADLVLLLSHCGLNTDLDLAEAVDGIDVIVGGHSHDLMTEPRRIGSTWIVQAGAHGEYVGHLTLTRLPKGWHAAGKLLPTAAVLPDSVLEARSPRNADPDDEIIGEAAADLLSEEYARETPLGNLTADLIRACAEADVALLRCSSVGGLRAGAIRLSDVKRLSHTGEDQVAVLHLTGQELRTVLEYGAREAYYLLTVAGGTVVVDGTQPLGHRVIGVTVGGAPLDPDRLYAVACSEILARGAAGFTPLVGKPYALLPETICETLAEHVRRVRRIDPQTDGRLIIEGALPVRAR